MVLQVNGARAREQFLWSVCPRLQLLRPSVRSSRLRKCRSIDTLGRNLEKPKFNNLLFQRATAAAALKVLEKLGFRFFKTFGAVTPCRASRHQVFKDSTALQGFKASKVLYRAFPTLIKKDTYQKRERTAAPLCKEYEFPTCSGSYSIDAIQIAENHFVNTCFHGVMSTWV